MSLDSEIVGVLQASAGVTALCSSSRIWGGRAKDNPVLTDYPHVVCRLVDDRPMDVTVQSVITLREARYQVEPFALTRAAAKAIAEACIDALQGYRSANASPAGTLIKDVQYEMQLEMYDDEISAWSAPCDFMIVHQG